MADHAELELETTLMTRNERRKQAMRKRLVAAARQVMADKGVDVTTIKDITEAADVGFGSFYNYFESKEEIVDAALEEILSGLGESIDAFNEAHPDPVEMMAAGVGNIARLARVEPVMSQFLVQAGMLNPNVGKNLSSRMARDVRLGIESGQFSVPDVETARVAISGAMFGFLRERLQGTLEEDADRHIVLMVLRLLGAEEAEAERLSREYKRIPLPGEET